MALFVLTLQAQTFAPNSACKECHPLIYEEYQTSQHANSSIFADKIHAAVWSRHPQNIKFGAYGCAHCHTPGADNLKDLVAKNSAVLPDVNNTTHTDGVSCAYCHRIEGVTFASKRNKNIISSKEKSFFTQKDIQAQTPYHQTVPFPEGISRSQVCIGCHSHKKNGNKFNVCVTDMPKSSDEQDCVSCHMPQQKRDDNTTYRFHGFAGINSYAPMLQEHVELKMETTKEGFAITIDNKTPHALSLHPLRVMQLRVTVDKKPLKSVSFLRVIGADGKPTPPWLAKEVVKDTSIQANEKRVVEFKYVLKAGDRVEATLGYYLVNPKALKSLGLQDEDEIKRFRVFKTQSFKMFTIAPQ